VTERSCARRIPRPVDEVWAVLADFGAIARWAPRVDHSCVLRAPHNGIGATRRVQVGRTTLLERVSVWDQGERLVYELEGLPPVVRRAENEWHLVADGPDATDVTLTSRVDCGSRPPQRAVARIIVGRLARESDGMLAGLERHLLDHAQEAARA
jgi:hypothetical protein